MKLPPMVSGDRLPYGGKTHVANTIPATFSIEETFDVGEDTGSPIIEDVYAVPFRCEALQKLTVKVGSD